MLDNILEIIVGLFIWMWFGLFAMGFIATFVDEIQNKIRKEENDS